jgi:hypothetical protein
MNELQLILPLPVRLDQAMDASRRIAPSLTTLLGRGARLSAETGLVGTACRALGIGKQRDWPLAPITALMDGLVPGDAYWVRVDPAHLEVGMGGLMLHPAGMLGLAGEESVALVSSLNRHWRDRGLEIVAPHPERWYLRLPTAPDLFTTPLDQVIGEYLTPHLPRGGDARRLMGLVNEAQMLMHGHPVNQARDEAGRPVVNGLWLWGGGILPRSGTTIDLVASDDPEIRALAGAAGARPQENPSRLQDLDGPGRSGRTLVTLAPSLGDFGLEDYLAKLERNWFRPVLRNLVLGRIRKVRLDLLTTPSQAAGVDTLRAWRFWR